MKSKKQKEIKAWAHVNLNKEIMGVYMRRVDAINACPMPNLIHKHKCVLPITLKL